MKYYIIQIICNLIGGALVAILTWYFLKLLKKYHNWNFQRIFGEDSASNFFIVYGQMKLLQPSFDKSGKLIEWPYYKEGLNKGFNVSSIVSFTETKSAKYISETFGEILNVAPKLISDNEIKEKLDISFCSIGGFNNFKTIDILGSKGNTFYDFDLTSPGCIFVKKDKEKKFCIDGIHDYALIIKIIPEAFPNRVWIVVAGLGEWGTSGASWFLSKQWKKLPKNKSFGLIIKVRGGQDESAEIVHQLTS